MQATHSVGFVVVAAVVVVVVVCAHSFQRLSPIGRACLSKCVAGE